MRGFPLRFWTELNSGLYYFLRMALLTSILVYFLEVGG